MDISAVLGNVFTQVLLLILCPYIFPFFRELIIKRFGESAQKWYYQLVELPKSYTIGAVANIITIPILFITGCWAKKPEIRFYKVDRCDGVECLHMSGYVKTITKYWWNPFIILGNYLSDMIVTMFGFAVAVVVCMFSLPNAFANLVDGFDQWLALSTEAPNIAYFVNMVFTFKDLTWDRFIMTGLNTNVFLVLLCVGVFIFMSGSRIPIIDDDTKGIDKDTFIIWGALSVMLIIYNLVHAFVDYTTYIVVADILAKIGITVLFVLLINFILDMIVWCFNLIVSIFTHNKINLKQKEQSK